MELPDGEELSASDTEKEEQQQQQQQKQQEEEEEEEEEGVESVFPHEELDDLPLTSAGVRKKWYRDVDIYRLGAMLIMLFSVMCAEFAVGFISNSLTLISDAYHLVSDCISLIVGIVAHQLAKRNRSSRRFSYGLAPAETIGGLVNGVFLMAVSLFIGLEAIQRFIQKPIITNPLLVVYVAAGALAVNLIGLLLFIGHSGSGHGHSHGGGGGGHGHSHGKKKKNKKNQVSESDVEEGSHERDSTSDNQEEDGEKKKKKKKHMDHNIRAVFLHVLGDALGALAAMISGLCIEYIPWDGRFYIDPALSLVIAAIITYSAAPLVWRCCVILMQSVPAGVDIEQLTKDLEEMDSVVRVHDLHVWSLGSRQIATAHVLCTHGTEFMEVAQQIKKTFHDYDIHFVTLQPEFIPLSAASSESSRCLLQCVNECDLMQEAKEGIQHRKRRKDKAIGADPNENPL
jgi:zinc transporter 1